MTTELISRKKAARWPNKVRTCCLPLAPNPKGDQSLRPQKVAPGPPGCQPELKSCELTEVVKPVTSFLGDFSPAQMCFTFCGHNQLQVTLLWVGQAHFAPPKRETRSKTLHQIAAQLPPRGRTCDRPRQRAFVSRSVRFQEEAQAGSPGEKGHLGKLRVLLGLHAKGAFAMRNLHQMSTPHYF